MRTFRLLVTRKQRLGKWGESVAIRFLRKRGMVLLDRNIRTPYGEIDLLLLDRAELVFVEVKTRQTGSFGTPLEALTKHKLLHLERAVASYLASQDKPIQFRIDAVAVLQTINRCSVQHVRNIATTAE